MFPGDTHLWTKHCVRWPSGYFENKGRSRTSPACVFPHYSITNSFALCSRLCLGLGKITHKLLLLACSHLEWHLPAPGADSDPRALPTTAEPYVTPSEPPQLLTVAFPSSETPCYSWRCLQRFFASVQTSLLYSSSQVLQHVWRYLSQNQAWVFQDSVPSHSRKDKDFSREIRNYWRFLHFKLQLFPSNLLFVGAINHSSHSFERVVAWNRERTGLIPTMAPQLYS